MLDTIEEPVAELHPLTKDDIDIKIEPTDKVYKLYFEREYLGDVGVDNADGELRYGNFCQRFHAKYPRCVPYKGVFMHPPKVILLSVSKTSDELREEYAAGQYKCSENR